MPNLAPAGMAAWTVLSLCSALALGESRTTGADSSPAVNASARLVDLEQRFEQALAEHDYEAAKQIDIELSAGVGSVHPGTPPCNAPQVFVRTSLLSPSDGPATVDTGPVTAFSATTDTAGTIWVAAAGTDTRVSLYRSSDFGTTWEQMLQFGNGADITQLELVYGPGDSSFVYVFYLAALDAGDLWLLRFDPRTSDWQVFPVAVGTDTVTDFAAAADRDRHHYLYCLYANEMRTGRNGNFTRSLDYGKTWQAAQPWWNCWDPHVSYSSGSSVHCTWRYAATGREIHFQTNRYYGRPTSWQPYRLVSPATQNCWSPVTAFADTGTEWKSAAWTCYTFARHDTQRLEVGYAWSTDAGWTWVTGCTLSTPGREGWQPDIVPYCGSPGGHVWLCYNTGGRGANQKTAVHLRSSNALGPGSWSPPLNLTDRRAAVSPPGTGPRVVCPAGSPRHWPGVLFGLYGPGSTSGIFFNAPWNFDIGRSRPRQQPGISVTPQSGRDLVVSFPVAVSGRYTLSVVTPAGRIAARLFSGHLESGHHRLRLSLRGIGSSVLCPGTCFLVLAGPGGSATAKLVVLR